MFKQENASLIAFYVLVADILVLGFAFFSIAPDPEHLHSRIYLFFKPEVSIEYALKLVGLILLISSVYTNISLWAYRNIPLTVLRTDINVNLSATLDVARVARSQTLRANLPNVTAYFSGVQPTSPGGTCTDIHMDVTCLDADYSNNSFELFGGPQSKGFEAIHSFGRPLRYRWFMVLLTPRFFDRPYNNLSAFFRKNLNRRTQNWTYHNEFDCIDPKMDFAAVDYPQHNINIRLEFEGGVPSTLRVRRISAQGVIDIHYAKEGKNLICFTVMRLHRERIRINWHNGATSTFLAAATPKC